MKTEIKQANKTYTNKDRETEQNKGRTITCQEEITNKQTNKRMNEQTKERQQQKT